MGLIVWGCLLPACLVAAWLFLRRPVRQFAEDWHVDHARELFRRQREWLEARFLGALAKVDPIERIRWDNAQWHDEVLWARDRHTRVFFALVGVHFESQSFDDLDEPHPRHATALFEFRKGRWCADGKHIDEIGPDEAVLCDHRFEPVVTHPRRAY